MRLFGSSITSGIGDLGGCGPRKRVCPDRWSLGSRNGITNRLRPKAQQKVELRVRLDTGHGHGEPGASMTDTNDIGSAQDSTVWTEIDWDDVYPRLLVVARGKLQRLTWRGRIGGAVPGAPTEQDLAQMAVLKTIDGRRRWKREVSLFQHLADVISSDINHLATSKENQTTLEVDDTVVQIEDYRMTPEAEVIRKTQEESFLVFLEARNPSLRQLAELILHESLRSTSEFSVKLNLSISQVESLKTALRRATKEYLERPESDPPRAVSDRRA
jgi:hypothetical protein